MTVTPSANTAGPEPWSIRSFGGELGPVSILAPHAGTWIPARVRSQLLFDEPDLDQEVICMTDWYTDCLALDALELSHAHGQAFINHLSRLVVDPERLDGEEEPMAAIGMGAVYQVTSDLQPLRAPDPIRDASLRAEHLVPYAAALARLVDEVLKTCGEVTIIDLHSYPSTPLPYELDSSAERPEICIGTDPFHTPSGLIEDVTGAFARQSLEVGLDTPFAGTYVPLAHLNRTPQVRSVMVEIRRDLYLEGPGGPLTSGYDDLVSCLASVVAGLHGDHLRRVGRRRS